MLLNFWEHAYVAYVGSSVILEQSSYDRKWDYVG